MSMGTLYDFKPLDLDAKTHPLTRYLSLICNLQYFKQKLKLIYLCTINIPIPVAYLKEMFIAWLNKILNSEKDDDLLKVSKLYNKITLVNVYSM